MNSTVTKYKKWPFLLLNLLLFLTSKNVIQGELCVSHNKSHDSLVDYI